MWLGDVTKWISCAIAGAVLGLAAIAALVVILSP
jgi:hypothetical protein